MTRDVVTFGAEVVLAALLITACAGAPPSPSAAESPTTAASTAASQADSTGGEAPKPAPTRRRSLLDEIQASGDRTMLRLAHVPANTRCSAGAQQVLNGRSRALHVDGPRRNADRIDYTVDGSENVLDTAKVVWNATCDLNGDSVTRQLVDAPPTAEPSKPPARPSKPTPASHSTGTPTG
jgi:hypothetical protein